MSFKLEKIQFDKYATSIKKVSDTEKFFIKFIKEMANRVLSRTIDRTPVDTGSLKSAWKLGKISGSGETISIEIKNGMEYASFIENGHRIVGDNVERDWWDGKFMLTISIDEILQEMPLRFQAEFIKFLISKGFKP